MIFKGRVQNGVIVPEGGTRLPDGAEVSISFSQEELPAETEAKKRRRQERRAIISQIISLPDENPGDTFSGADHDHVLYGTP